MVYSNYETYSNQNMLFEVINLSVTNDWIGLTANYQHASPSFSPAIIVHENSQSNVQFGKDLGNARHIFAG